MFSYDAAQLILFDFLLFLKNSLSYIIFCEKVIPTKHLNSKDKKKSLTVLYNILIILLTGTDEEALINVLCYRSNPQRQEIRSTFKTMFGKVGMLSCLF